MTNPGFAPDSVYAEWTDEERAASDRMEAEHNTRRRAIIALADLNRGADHDRAGGTKGQTGPLWISGPTVRTYTDDMLRRAAKRLRRKLEDVADGDHNLPAKGRGSARGYVRFLKVQLRDVAREQEWRGALAESWLAREDGTDCYTSFQARGGLLGVSDHGARPPSYDLAALLDRELHLLGLPTVLAWPDREPAEERAA